MRARLAPCLVVLLTFAAVFGVHSVAGARRVTETRIQPLTAEDLGAGGALEIRTRGQGFVAILRRGAGPLPRWGMLALVAPDDRMTPYVPLHLLADTDVRVELPAPPGGYETHDLRVALRTRRGAERSIVRVAPMGRFLVEPQILLRGADTVVAGSAWSPRIVVRRSDDGGAMTGAKVRVRLLEAGAKATRPLLIAHALADDTGAARITMNLEQGWTGDHRLLVDVRSDAGPATASFPFTVERRARVLLSTDKPIYQPGQTIHLRVLARHASHGRALGDVPVSFTLRDARDNKVFAHKGRTSAQGVYGTTFDIASRVNMGRWRLTAEVDGHTAARTIEVKRYVLPKMKVRVEADRPSYKPGDTVKGTITAAYFFGEPVAAGRVALFVETVDVGVRELARLELGLDADGSVPFEIPLPRVLHGRADTGGAALVRLRAEITDSAGQKAKGQAAVPVWASDLRLAVLPEAGRLISGVENHVFVVVTRPDGTPVDDAAVEVAHTGLAPVELRTDATGVAVWKGRPVRRRADFVVDARAADGARAHWSDRLPSDAGAAAHVLLRPDAPAPRVGQHVSFAVHTAGGLPQIFVDLVRGGQTLLTASAPVVKGRADVQLTLPQDAEGTILAHAYALGLDGEVYADTRPMVVRPAQDLEVTLSTEREVYRPGEEVSLNVRVTDSAGHPVLAALGLWIVDEAVFALSELRPGMEKVFFLLEQELLKPKVEIHGFHGHELAQEGGDVRRDTAARVLSAAAMPSFSHARKIDSLSAARAASDARWLKHVEKRIAPIRARVHEWVDDEGRLPNDNRELRKVLGRAGLNLDRVRDPFGVGWRLEAGWIGDARLASAGPDTKWSTGDDIRVHLQLQQAMQKVYRRQSKKSRRRGGFMRAVRGALGMAGGGPRMEAAGMEAFDMDGAALAAPGAVAEMPAVAKAKRPAASEPAPDDDARPGDASATRKDKRASGPVRVRSWFPETLFSAPLLLTDEKGEARVAFRAADSITTWRMSAMANTAGGVMGSTSAPLRVFQDFFVDVDLPVALTRGDRVSVPLAVYNYLDEAQEVRLEVAALGGVEHRGAGPQVVHLAAGEVRGVSLDLEATGVGTATVTVTARGARMSDAVRRPVRVEPDGFEVTHSESGMLDGSQRFALQVPQGAIDGASQLRIKLYPGLFAQVVDGLESMLRMPSGCFEQTSSTTYPNLLVLRYLRDSGTSRPELEAKALGMLQAGWQRLVTYEVDGGGFSWFGNPPSNRILTAYGLMEFADMARVMPIDEAVVERTRGWLLGQQSADGSFKPDAHFLHQESWGDLQKSTLRVSAYITWALAHARTDRAGLTPRLERALGYLAAHAEDAKDPYELAYIANAFAEAAFDRRPSRAHERTLADSLRRLAASARRTDDGVHFETGVRTAMYGSGLSANIEVTALALRAFMRAGKHLDLLEPGLRWLVASKAPSGHWHSTQATIQVLQVLVASLSTSTDPEPGRVQVRVNGEPVETITYTPENADVVRFVDASRHLMTGENTVELVPSEETRPMFQITTRAWLPWTDERRPAKQDFVVDVAYDRAKLAVDDTVGVRVSVRSNLGAVAKMGMVDVGLPPGFDLVAADLDRAVTSGTIQRYERAGRQLILYVPELRPDRPFEVTYQLRARYPVRAAAGAARAYSYYDPSQNGDTAPTELLVQ